MKGFKQYRRTQIAELRPVEESEIIYYGIQKRLCTEGGLEYEISISDADKANGSPKIGDMIARNPKNYNDQWLVSEQYFKNNFEPVKPEDL